MFVFQPRNYRKVKHQAHLNRDSRGCGSAANKELSSQRVDAASRCAHLFIPPFCFYKYIILICSFLLLKHAPVYCKVVALSQSDASLCGCIEVKWGREMFRNSLEFGDFVKKLQVYVPQGREVLGDVRVKFGCCGDSWQQVKYFI